MKVQQPAEATGIFVSPPKFIANKYQRGRLIQGNAAAGNQQQQEDNNMMELSAEDAENCRKFRLTTLYRMALVWTKPEDSIASADGTSRAPILLRNLNPCSKYWPARREHLPARY